MRNGKIRMPDLVSDFTQGACVEQRENIKEERNLIPPTTPHFSPLRPKMFFLL